VAVLWRLWRQQCLQHVVLPAPPVTSWRLSLQGMTSWKLSYQQKERLDQLDCGKCVAAAVVP
jgi:hypothetical protein